jgi:predicted DNA-binding transcriptional regulator AlpA
MAKETSIIGEEEMTTDHLWDVEDVARFLGLSVGSIYHLSSAARIPCIRLSARCLRFQPSVIRAWINEKSSGSVAKEAKKIR